MYPLVLGGVLFLEALVAYPASPDREVGVQKKLQSLGNSEIDELVALAEEIADQFRQQRLSAFPSAICLKAEVEPVFAQEHLDQLRQFTSVVTLSYRLWN